MVFKFIHCIQWYVQNQAVLLKMGKHTGITSMCAVPMDSTNYIPIAKCPPISDQIVIGTPGTIKQWMSARKLSMREVKILVFDEADHMLAEVIALCIFFWGNILLFNYAFLVLFKYHLNLHLIDLRLFLMNPKFSSKLMGVYHYKSAPSGSGPLK